MAPSLITDTICRYVNLYVLNHSKKYKSIEEIKKILPAEKKLLGIEDYNITIKLSTNRNKSKCVRSGEKRCDIYLGENHLTLGVLRHELKHAAQNKTLTDT